MFYMDCENVRVCSKTATRTLTVTYIIDGMENHYNLCDEHAVETKNEFESSKPTNYADGYTVDLKSLS